MLSLVLAFFSLFVGQFYVSAPPADGCVVIAGLDGVRAWTLSGYYCTGTVSYSQVPVFSTTLCCFFVI